MERLKQWGHDRRHWSEHWHELDDSDNLDTCGHGGYSELRTATRGCRTRKRAFHFCSPGVVWRSHDVARHVRARHASKCPKSTLGGQDIFAQKICMNKMPEFYMILARRIIHIPDFYNYICPKINKILEFYMIFAKKMPEFYIIITPKIFSRILGDMPPHPFSRLIFLWLLIN